MLNARHGGDLAGIMQHLDYLDSLGVTTSGQHLCWKMIWEKVLITVMPQLIIIK